MIPHNLIFDLLGFSWLFLGFTSSKSSTASTQSSSTQTQYNTTDKRVGVEGEGNVVAGEGAQVEISVTDVSDQIAKAALDAAQETAESALRANTDAIGRAASLSSDALAANVTAARRALDTADRSVGAVSSAFVNLSADQVRLLSDLVKSNAATTEATREGNSRLASSLVEKSLLAVADSKTDTNEKIVTTAVEYFAYAAIAAAVAFALSRRKAA